MSAVISALLYVELGDTSARQRTILRRVLLGHRWRPLAKHDFAFVMEIRGATSDHQIVNRATRNVHAAVAAAAVSDWSAECILAQGPIRKRDQKLCR